jgi:hypothetical protein
MTRWRERHPSMARWFVSLGASVISLVLVLLMEKDVVPHLWEVLGSGVVVYFVIRYAQRHSLGR